MLALAAIAASCLGLSQLLPELTGSSVPWRHVSGWFLLACGVVLGWSAWRCSEPFIWRWAFWRWLLVGCLAIYVLTVFCVGGSSSARYLFRALAAAWVVTLANPWATQWHGNRWLRGLDLVASNIGLFLILGELTLRAYASWSGQSLLVREGLEAYRLAPNRNYGGLLFTNSLGYPSREFERDKRPGVRRIAVLGDSFAVGTVRQEQNFVTVLEQLLPATEVYNFGISGAGPREYYEILQSDVWPYSPDLVIVCVFVGNDISERVVVPSDRRMQPESHRLYLFAQRTWRLGREWYRRKSESPASHRAYQPFYFGPLSRQTHLHVEAERLRVCQPSQGGGLEKHWQRALAHLERVSTACDSRKTPVVFVLIPDEYQVNPQLLAEVLEHASVSRDDVDLDLPQRRLKSFFAERGIACLDLKPVFTEAVDTYRPRDTHWNEAGNRLAAEHIAVWLSEMLSARIK